MFPARADFCVIPFTDEAVFNEHASKAEFWRTTDFHGLDLSVLHTKAYTEKFQQPILDTYDPQKNLAADPFRKCFDFEKCSLEDLLTVKLSFEHKMTKTAILHGYAIYFDAVFSGQDFFVTLGTGPENPATHWYQTRLFIPEPLGVNKGQSIQAQLTMLANDQQTYDC